MVLFFPHEKFKSLEPTLIDHQTAPTNTHARAHTKFQLIYYAKNLITANQNAIMATVTAKVNTT